VSGESDVMVDRELCSGEVVDRLEMQWRGRLNTFHACTAFTSPRGLFATNTPTAYGVLSQAHETKKAAKRRSRQSEAR
jgi:hypothetical protein